MSMSVSRVVRGVVVVGLSVGVLAVGTASAQSPAVQSPPSGVQQAIQQVPPPASTATSLSSPTVIEQIVVKVNGDILTKTELESRQVDMLRQRGPLPKTEQELQKAVAAMMPALLVETVDELLLVQRGRELGYKLSDERFKEIIAGIRKNNNLETDEAFQAALRAEGLSLADLRQRFEVNVLRQQVVQQEVMSRISVNEEEARKYYAEHGKEFTTPAALTLREILVNVPTDGKTVNVGLEEEAKAKADAARARVLKGEPFESVAAEVSDAASKANGGLIGPLNLEDLSPQLQQSISKMKPGEVSEVVRTARGFFFFRLETAAEATVLSFEQAREQIGNRIGDSKYGAELDKYMRKLRGEAIIEWKSPELKKLYDMQLAAKPAEKTGL